MTEAKSPEKDNRGILPEGSSSALSVRDGIEDGHKQEYHEAEDQRLLWSEGFGEETPEELGRIET